MIENNKTAEIPQVNAGTGCAGCLSVFLRLIGLGLAGGGVFAIYSIMEDSYWDVAVNFTEFLFPGYLILFGLFFFIIPSSKTFPYYGSHEIDYLREEIRFGISGDPARPYAVPFGAISFIYLEKITRRHKRHTYHSYRIYLIKRDGAELLMSVFSDSASFKEFVNDLAEKTGFQVKDDSGNELEREASKSYEFKEENYGATPSSFVKEKSSEVGQHIELLPGKKGGKYYLIMGIIYLIFGGAGFLIFSQFTDLFGDTAPLPVVIIFGLFSIIMIGAIVFALLFLFLSTQKKFRLICSLRELEIHIYLFTNPLIRGLFKTKITIPRDKVKHVRVNRGPSGDFYLSISVARDFSWGSKIKELLVRAVPGNLSSVSETALEKDRVIILWGIPAIRDLKKYPGIGDLLYAERRLQQILNLTEEEISG